MNTEKIGFIGLGNMGYPMAKNLEKAGFPLSVYNRTIQKTTGFRENSTVYESISGVVTNADILFTMLTNDLAVNQVYQEILEENIQGKLFVDLSTISPAKSLEINEKIKTKGGSFIDAPVAGSTGPATEGTLIIMVGGQQRDVQRAHPCLEKMGKQVEHLGGNGKGLAAKISINYFLGMLYEGLAETLLLSDSLGIERKAMLDIINQSASGSGATKVKTPILLNNDFKPAFALDLMLKDLLLARDAGADFPVGKIAIETYQKAHDVGYGKEDVMGVINYLKKT
ncbi:NAD(P)-dependent oxidoreductase [Arachidicoccus terrestris]|uniref:NAD(P)-dependent oxidoreductase n=1 Tax=Arachidicoccus terrestris TaxID=2875539 RepID=UPI001CC56B97|nr:NAD(P)-dependent oxidoreductase [Arachidicoccus terrestris]UAY54374.1 NAD(P)-dependent oxidoreductase [Arachidicoccus terrestris]